MGALKAPKVSKIEQIVCWCHFTRLLKLDKVSYFKIFNVINKKAEKTAFLFRKAPPHPIARSIRPTMCSDALFFLLFLLPERIKLNGNGSKIEENPRPSHFG